MLLSFSTWWASMEVISKIYWMVAIPFTLLFMFQLVMTFVAGGVDHDLDVHTDHVDVGHADFNLLTIKNLIAFFAIFGWTGIACIEGGLGTGLSVFISVFCGSVMMVVMAAIHYFMSKLADSGTLEMKNAIGKTGEVYLTIPARKTGSGKLQVKVQSSVRTLDAMTDELEDIKTGSIVEVVDLIGENILMVRRSR